MIKEKTTTSKYFRTKYFSKSRNFLLPLINGGENEQKGLLKSYLFAEGVEENIYDYFLLCEIEKNTELNKALSSFLYSTYMTEDGTELCLFDLSSVKEDVDSFIKGEYSQYTEHSKKKILSFFKWTKGKNGPVLSITEAKKLKTAEDLHFYVFLYPQEFKEEVAEEMHSVYNLFGTYHDALSVIKDMKELCPVFDKEKETLNKKII